MAYNFSKLSITLALIAASLGGWVAEASDFRSPRTTALGGAGHASPLLNDAIYLNPSFTSFMQVYSVSATFLNFNGQANANSPERKGRNYNVSLLDGRSEIFQAGAGYTVRDDGAFVHVGASKRLIEQLGVGIGGKLLLDNSRFPKTGHDAMASVAYTPLSWLQAVIVVDNILETTESKQRGMYREFILGTKFSVNQRLMIYLDPHMIPNSPSASKVGHELGVEVAPFNDFFLRAGTFKNAMIPELGMLGRGYGFGAGWVAPKISFDYGISKAIEPVPTTSHVFGATIYL